MTPKPKDRTVEDMISQADQIRSQLESLKSSSEKADKQKEKDLEEQLWNLWKEVTAKLDSSDLTHVQRTKLEALKLTLSPFMNELASLQWAVEQSTNWNQEDEEQGNNWNPWTNNRGTQGNTPSQSPTENQSDESSNEEKSWLGKSWDWTKEQWQDVWDKEKWSNEAWLNVLRTAWFVATGVWAAALIYKWFKKLFGSDEEEVEEEEVEEKPKKKKKKKHDDDNDGEMSWWKKFLIGAWVTVWTVVGWVEVYKHWNKISSRVKEKLWLSLTFDEARQKVESEVRNWKVDDDHFWVFNAHFEWGITFDEQTQEICSYGQRTKIDKNSKKLQWMDVEFPSWEEMIHAANIVNFAKRMLRWRGATSTPFCQTEWWGDIAFNCSVNWKQDFLAANNSNEWSRILWTFWTVGWGLLWGYCAWVQWAAIWAVWGWVWGYALWAYIDNNSSAWRCCATIAKWANFDRFLIYLNWQTDENWKSLWEAVGEQHVDTGWSPINGVVDNWEEWTAWDGVLAEIENSFWEDQSWRRNLKIEWNEANPEEYKIQSYGHELKLTLKWWPKKKWEAIDYSKIESIHIEKYDEYHSRWDWLDIDFPHTEDGLKEAIRVANLTNMIVEDWKWKGWEAYPFAYWRYKTPFNLDIDTDWNWGSAVLSHSMLEKRFPTIFNDLWEYPYVRWVFWIQEEMHDQAVHDKAEGSQYIKFLHQIGKWSFWKKVW